VYVNYYDAQYAGYDVYGMTSYRSRYYGTKNYNEGNTPVVFNCNIESFHKVEERLYNISV